MMIGVAIMTKCTGPKVDWWNGVGMQHMRVLERKMILSRLAKERLNAHWVDKELGGQILAQVKI